MALTPKHNELLNTIATHDIITVFIKGIYAKERLQCHPMEVWHSATSPTNGWDLLWRFCAEGMFTAESSLMTPYATLSYYYFLV